MFSKILIANRGEIAVRIIRACKEMGVATVAVYSKADQNALHVALADQSYCIGEGEAAESYLNENQIISTAILAGAQAIHPGYGFLSENARFARLCRKNGLVFIGPRPESMEQLSDKAVLKELMRSAGLSVIPGTQALPTAQAAREAAREIGYPVLLKACAGGGGRGIRLIRSEEDLDEAYHQATAEASAAFGDGSVYLEKYVFPARHVELQMLADEQGNVVCLGERDCSLQRRNQKLLEESPSRALTPQLREQMGAAAVAAARAAGYENAGTVEFVVDQEGNFYFIEMNTRIQVEHPVTELVTGLDLVREQVRVAAGLPLSVTQEEVSLRGHAIECRIHAEDPAHTLRPSPGKVGFLHLPGGFGVRVDTGLYPGCELPAHYDSLMAKIIVHAPTRLEAIRRMRRSLEELIIEGPAANTDLLHQILYHPDFVRGNYNTGFLEDHLDTLLAWSGSGEEGEA